MKLLVKLSLCLLALIFVLLAVPAWAAVQLGGYLESDWGWYSEKEKDSTAIATLQVRYNLTAIKQIESGFFMKAYAQARATESGAATVRDVWLQAGNPTVDLKVGRFEKISLFERGEDVFIVPVESAASVVEYRAEVHSTLGRNPGDLALDYRVNDKLTLEVGGVWFPSVFKLTGNAANDVGIRPLIAYKTDKFLFRFGGEYRNRKVQDTTETEEGRDTYCVGGTTAYTFGRNTIGLSSGYRIDYPYSAEGKKEVDVFTLTVGGYAKIGVGEKDTLSFGAFYTDFKQNFTEVLPNPDHHASILQTYVSYLHPLKIEGATLKFCVSYSKSGIDEDERGLGGVMRISYAL